MEDNLTMTLAQRALGSPPPNQSNKVPPAWDRWLMGEMMKKAYLNNWSPNPILMQVLGERVNGKPGKDYNGNTHTTSERT